MSQESEESQHDIGPSIVDGSVQIWLLALNAKCSNSVKRGPFIYIFIALPIQLLKNVSALYCTESNDKLLLCTQEFSFQIGSLQADRCAMKFGELDSHEEFEKCDRLRQ